MTAAQLIRWHPPVWRRRYAEEVSTLLADRELSTSDQLDLLRSCADAWRRETRVDVFLVPFTLALGGIFFGTRLRAAGTMPAGLDVVLALPALLIFVALVIAGIRRNWRRFLRGSSVAPPPRLVLPRVAAMIAMCAMFLAAIHVGWHPAAAASDFSRFEAVIALIGAASLTSEIYRRAPWVDDPPPVSWALARYLERHGIDPDKAARS